MKQKQTRVGDRGNGLLPAGTAPIHNTADAGSQAEDDERGLDRIIFFSDAVFAIAITLLALDIRLPPLPETAGNADLLAALGHTWPQFLSYSISFLAIGMIWLAHHRTFRSVQRYDERLMLLNLFFLLLIGFVPFPTTVIGEYGNTVSTVFYAATMATAVRRTSAPLASRPGRNPWIRATRRITERLSHRTSAASNTGLGVMAVRIALRRAILEISATAASARARAASGRAPPSSAPSRPPSASSSSSTPPAR